jgi:hypothetical protein
MAHFGNSALVNDVLDTENGEDTQSTQREDAEGLP